MWSELRAGEGSGPVLPEVAGERCVHAHIHRASCRACVDACPRYAWVIDEEVLGIDENKCDGCDLCIPACPQGAIEARFFPSLKATNQGGVAFAACERAGVENPDQGFMPCLHALGMTDLLRLHREGAGLLVTSCGDCERCERGGAERLEQRLDEVNRLLASRGLERLKHRSLDAGAWVKEFHRISELAARRHLDRRAFFRSAFRLPKERLVAAFEDTAGTFVPPGLLLEADAAAGLFPHVPEIDPENCNGCDACVRLCPLEAIRFDTTSHGQAAYRIHAERCSGCRICVDVCEKDAISIASLTRSAKPRISLRVSRCSACGADFHVPAKGSHREPLCWVCHNRNHRKNLYQVLD